MTSQFLKKAFAGLALLAAGLFLTVSSLGCGPRPPDSPGNPKLVWSPDGEYIIFSPQYLGVFVVDAAGTRLWTIPENTPVGTGSYPGNFAPALSPDGSRLAYVTFWEYGNTEIMTAALDGTDAQRLTHDDAYDTNPTWSPDGSQIAFITGYSEAQLAVMDADGSNKWLLAPSVNLKGHPSGQSPAWSPDGSWIAFVGREGNFAEGIRNVLYTVRPDGSGLTEIGELADSWAWSWSPQRNQIAFLGAGEDVATRKNYRRLLYTISPDGSAFYVVAEAEGIPAWSPDGSWLAFSRSDYRGSGIYVARPDGSDLRQVIQGHGGPISWAADGTELYVAGLAYAVRLDGQGLRQFLPGGVRDLSAWSPDGSQLAVLLGPSFSGTANQENIRQVLAVLEPDEHESGMRVVVLGYGDRLLAEAEHAVWADIPLNIEACDEGFIVPKPHENPGLVQDCKTLITVRDRLAGETYLNWSAAFPITDWEGVEIGGSPLRVIRLNLLHLWSRGGTVPSEIGDLVALQSLNLAASNLSGSIPPELGSIAGLQELHLEGNELSGNIPSELGNLSNLRGLYLFDNRLSGNIPPELGNLKKLKELYLHENRLTGGIPLELGNLGNLRQFAVSMNDLTGPIPPELGNLESLWGLYISSNSLTGCVPAPLSSHLIVLETDGLDYCE